MKLSFKAIAVLCLVVFIVSPSKAGGPWLLKKGDGYFQLQAIPLLYSYKKLLNGTRLASTPINRPVYVVDYGFYGEYGITDRINLIANVPLKFVNIKGVTETPDAYLNLLDEGSIHGFSNIRLGAKMKLVDQSVKIALSVNTSLNTGRTEIEKGLSTGYQGTSAGLMAHIGGGFGNNWYAFGEFGFYHMFSDFDDALEGAVELGKSFTDRFTASLRFDIRKSLENGEYFDERLRQTGLYSTNQSWVVGALKLNYEINNKYGFNLALPVAPLTFQNIGFAGSLAVGAYIKV